jgi:hypothetical protein
MKGKHERIIFFLGCSRCQIYLYVAAPKIIVNVAVQGTNESKIIIEQKNPFGSV